MAVEFDNIRTTPGTGTLADHGSDSLVPASSSSHVAITTPTGVASGDVQVPHYALSTLPSHYANNSINTARITWSLTNAGTTDALTDNTYTLTYFYYQGASSAAGTPTVTGSKSYTYAEMLTMFGGTSTVSVGLSGSTGSLINERQTLAFPATYPYTVNYRVQTAAGVNTTIPVTGLTSKTGTLPAGPADVGPLPTAPTGYELVAGQSTHVTISSTGTNTFTYYYRDLPPTLTGVTDAHVELGSTFDPRAGVSATDGVDGNITANITISGTVDTNTPGTYQLIYSVTDSAGNTVTATRVITVSDTTAPAAPTINPIAETATTVSGTAEPGSTVRVTFPDGSTGTTTTDASGAWTLPAPSPLMGGQQVSATATDAAGNQSPPASVTIATEYVSTTITKVWDDPLLTTYPDAEVVVLQNGTAYRTVPIAGGVLAGGTTQVTPTDLPRYAADATEYTYTITETPPAGYTVAITGDRTAGFTVTNTRILADVVLTKTNPAGDPVTGATYGLFAADGTSLGTAITDAAGQVTFTSLPVGDYYLQETAAPAGYRLADAQHTFSVVEGQPTIALATVDHPLLTEFPATSGTSTAPFTIVGLALLVAGALRLVPTKKTNPRNPLIAEPRKK